MENASQTTNNLATFGAGCFWGVQLAFQRIPGVETTTVGYANGTVDDPNYEVVCTGKSGYTEVVQMKYNPDTVSYEQLLDKFWSIHDPTTLNRQVFDCGCGCCCCVCLLCHVDDILCKI